MPRILKTEEIKELFICAVYAVTVGVILAAAVLSAINFVVQL